MFSSVVIRYIFFNTGPTVSIFTNQTSHPIRMGKREKSLIKIKLIRSQSGVRNGDRSFIAQITRHRRKPGCVSWIEIEKIYVSIVRVVVTAGWFWGRAIALASAALRGTLPDVPRRVRGPKIVVVFAAAQCREWRDCARGAVHTQQTR